MGLIARVDDMGKLAWIGLMIVGFVVFWPLGLAMLAFLIGSGRLKGSGDMGCSRGERGEWRRRWKEMKQEFRQQRREARNEFRSAWRSGESSGNSAFDEYRVETLKRLEAEQQEFYEFLDRLRHAKDKQEFDQFMAERGRRTDPGPQPEPQA